jgi:putative transposase
MLVWLFVLVTALLFTPVLFVLARVAKRRNRQQRQGFARRPAPDPAVIDALAPPTRKKPEWVVQEVLRLKALMGKHAGCRKVAGTFNRLHAAHQVGKSFVSDTIRNHRYELLNITRELRDERPAPVRVNRVRGVDLTKRHPDR